MSTNKETDRGRVMEERRGRAEGVAAMQADGLAGVAAMHESIPPIEREMEMEMESESAAPIRGRGRGRRRFFTWGL